MADSALVGHRVRVETVVLVQLAIAVLGVCVLAIAAAPALTRPGRAALRSQANPAAESMPALLRVLSGRISHLWRELVVAATAAARSGRVHRARAVEATRRGSERVVAEVGTRVRNARAGSYQARHARGPQTNPPGYTRLERSERVIDLRDRRTIGDPSYRPRHRA